MNFVKAQSSKRKANSLSQSFVSFEREEGQFQFTKFSLSIWQWTFPHNPWPSESSFEGSSNQFNSEWASYRLAFLPNWDGSFRLFHVSLSRKLILEHVKVIENLKTVCSKMSRNYFSFFIPHSTDWQIWPFCKFRRKKILPRILHFHSKQVFFLHMLLLSPWVARNFFSLRWLLIRLQKQFENNKVSLQFRNTETTKFIILQTAI